MSSKVNYLQSLPASSNVQDANFGQLARHTRVTVDEISWWEKHVEPVKNVKRKQHVLRGPRHRSRKLTRLPVDRIGTLIRRETGET